MSCLVCCPCLPLISINGAWRVVISEPPLSIAGLRGLRGLARQGLLVHTGWGEAMGVGVNAVDTY